MYCFESFYGDVPQKTHNSAKTKDFNSSLECCIYVWRKGQIAELLNVRKVIQQRLSVSSRNLSANNDRMIRRFVDHI